MLNYDFAATGAQFPPPVEIKAFLVAVPVAN